METLKSPKSPSIGTEARRAVAILRGYLEQRIIGQEYLINRMLISLLADGHLLVEGAPGLAKTTAIKELAATIKADFHRIQFTPDLLPADLTGTEVFRPQDGTFSFQPGPIFHNLVLADEINRAPAKVQSALLEAMAERQITVGRTTYALPTLFMVMATQNPIEHEGTYALPEAQLDRFLMYVRIDYPNPKTEQAILHLHRATLCRSSQESAKRPRPIISEEAVFSVRQEILAMHMSPAIEDYLVQIVVSTRDPEPFGKDLKRWVQYGASPRATLGLDRAARAHAWLADRDYVSPEDILAVAPDILRHRIILNFEAEAEGITTDRFIDALLERIPIP